MPEVRKARAIGFNHVALEVGDIEEALAFYGRIFDFELRGKSDSMAFIDLGDQFLALQKGRKQPSDDGRHFGLVVDDKDAVRRAMAEAGVEPEWPGQRGSGVEIDRDPLVAMVICPGERGVDERVPDALSACAGQGGGRPDAGLAVGAQARYR